MYQCPISFFTKNIIFNQDKSAWAVYKLSGFDYDFLDDDAKLRYCTKRHVSSAESCQKHRYLCCPSNRIYRGSSSL